MPGAPAPGFFFGPRLMLLRPTQVSSSRDESGEALRSMGFLTAPARQVKAHQCLEHPPMIGHLEVQQLVHHHVVLEGPVLSRKIDRQRDDSRGRAGPPLPGHALHPQNPRPDSKPRGPVLDPRSQAHMPRLTAPHRHSRRAGPKGSGRPTRARSSLPRPSSGR